MFGASEGGFRASRVGFRGLGFRGLGLRGLGVAGIGLRVSELIQCHT